MGSLVFANFEWLDHPTHSFLEFPDNGSKTISFKIKNTSSSVNILSSNKRACGQNSCCLSSYPKVPISPGETALIEVKCTLKSSQNLEKRRFELSLKDGNKLDYTIKINVNIRQKKRCCICEVDDISDEQRDTECYRWFIDNKCDVEKKIQFGSALPKIQDCSSVKHSIMAHSWYNEKNVNAYIDRVVSVCHAFPNDKIETQHFGCATFGDLNTTTQGLSKLLSSTPENESVVVTANQCVSFGYDPLGLGNLPSLTPISYTVKDSKVMQSDLNLCRVGKRCGRLHGWSSRCKRISDGVYTEDQQICCVDPSLNTLTTQHTYQPGKICDDEIKCSKIENMSCSDSSLPVSCTNSQGLIETLRCTENIPKKKHRFTYKYK